MSKLDRIRHFLNENKAGLAIVSDPVTVNYLTGFDCDPHERQMFLFVYENREPALFVPALEVARASAVLDFPVFGYVDSENPWQKIKAGLASTDSSIIYAEFDNLNVTKFQGLQTVFEGRFENLTPFIQKMRVIKSAMVLTGNNAANPHGIPGSNKIEKDALLLFDLGCMVNGYASDMTRTVAVGKPDDFKKEIYHLTLEAQQAALDMIKPGVTASEVDAAARNVIEKAGYGEYFNHRLGHGIGMDVHEFPSIMEGNDMVIEEGMCFSVEPGIYIPEKVGVRIEDCGYVTKDGFEVFTHTPKELLYFDV